jgi:arginyl-tRNA synthetase
MRQKNVEKHMKDELAAAIALAITELFNVTVSVELSRPDEQFGDFATNVALQLTKLVGQNPHAIAERLKPKLESSLAGWVSEVSIAGPGFLNMRLRTY